MPPGKTLRLCLCSHGAGYNSFEWSCTAYAFTEHSWTRWFWDSVRAQQNALKNARIRTISRLTKNLCKFWTDFCPPLIKSTWKTKGYRGFRNRYGAEKLMKNQKYNNGTGISFVDRYNVIFAWEQLQRIDGTCLWRCKAGAVYKYSLQYQGYGKCAIHSRIWCHCAKGQYREVETRTESALFTHQRGRTADMLHRESIA